MSGLKIIQPGVLSLLQDAGRFGQHNIGLTTGGPMDGNAFYWANRLLNNHHNATQVEITIGGFKAEFIVATQIAVTGAELPLTINGKEKALWRTHSVKAGDVIELGFAKSGSRAYLAVAQGFNVTGSFTSSSTVMREKVGGLDGDKLKTGDVADCHGVSNDNNVSLPTESIPQYPNSVVLRLVMGYQQRHFSNLAKAKFFNCEYQVSERCDRMGFRLTGAEVAADIQGMLSEGICMGAVQIPADGQPIVLLNDRQTIGGYPKIGAVIAEDCSRLAQLGQGGKVRFEQISIEQANNIKHLTCNRLANIQLEPCDD